MQVKNNPVDLAAQWMLNSGIQSDKGGFYAWYDLRNKSYSYLYSEITGYAITTLLFLYRILKDKTFLTKATEAAEWIIEHALHSCGGVKTRLYKADNNIDNLYSFSGENIFSFDTGMVLYGMVNLYKVSGEEVFLETSERMVKFLLDNMQNKDGSLSPIYNAKTGDKFESHDKWSSQSGAFHAKVCLGLADLFGVTQDKKYKDAAVKLCDYVLTMQDESGRFVTDRINNTTHLHPYCYAAEGLLYTGASFGVDRFINSAKKATEWMFKNLSSAGINELYDPQTKTFNDLQRSDILAQVLRLGLIFSVGGKIDKLKTPLLEYQYLGENPSQTGGFLYTKDEQHINSWCTMFAIQALAFYQDKDLIPKDKKIELLI